MKDFLEKDVDTTADTIENLINLYSKNGNWCTGDNLTYADLFVYEMVAHYFPSEESYIEKYPRLYKIKKNVEENSKVSNYIRKQSGQKSKVHEQREE